MNKLLLNLCVVFTLVFLTSCSTEEINPSIEGVWKLTAWNIDEGFDINTDGITSTNLLNEIDCSYSETLLFEANGVVSLNTTFNPSIEIALLDDTTNDYSFNVECDTEGVISLATSYSQNGDTLMIGDSNASIDGNQISMTFKESIEIYNEDFSEVIGTKDLTLVYVKQ